MQQLFFEDFASGQRLPAAEMLVSAEDAAGFAAEFDPLASKRIDLSSGRARASMTSPWHVSAMGMRMICDAFMNRTAALGAPGVEAVEWLGSVDVGDRLRLDSHVSTVRPSKSRPELGLVGVDLTWTNQRDECVMKQSNVIMVLRRTKEPAP